MPKKSVSDRRRPRFAGVSSMALAITCLGGANGSAADPGTAVDKISTATPIKHVLIIIGENRSFDHLYATYVPKNRDERMLNLLSEGIVNADGTPGPNFADGHQYRITSAPNGGKFFISANLKSKALYNVLPAPDIGGVQNPPAIAVLSIPGGDPGLPPRSQFLFGTGGAGLSRESARHPHNKCQRAAPRPVPDDRSDNAL